MLNRALHWWSWIPMNLNYFIIDPFLSMIRYSEQVGGKSDRL